MYKLVDYDDIENKTKINIVIISSVYTTKKLPRVNPGSIWIESTRVYFCSVNTYLFGLNQLMEVG